MMPNLTLLFPLLTGWKLHGEVIPAGFSLVEEGGWGKGIGLCLHSPDRYRLLFAAQDKPGTVGRGAAAVPAHRPL